MYPCDSSASRDLVYLQSVYFSLTCWVCPRGFAGKRWPTIMIVVWKPRDNITVKESWKKNKKSVSPLELEIFIRSLRIVVRRSAFLQERSPTWEELEASWEAHVLTISLASGVVLSGRAQKMSWRRWSNEKKWCPTMLKYNLLIYLVWF